MSAQPAQEHDPDDPLEILRMLPERFHEQFPDKYAAVTEVARRPEGYQSTSCHAQAVAADRNRLLRARFRRSAWQPSRGRASRQPRRLSADRGTRPGLVWPTEPTVTYRVRFEAYALVQLNGLATLSMRYSNES